MSAEKLFPLCVAGSACSNAVALGMYGISLPDAIVLTLTPSHSPFFLSATFILSQLAKVGSKLEQAQALVPNWGLKGQVYTQSMVAVWLAQTCYMHREHKEAQAFLTPQGRVRGPFQICYRTTASGEAEVLQILPRSSSTSVGCSRCTQQSRP